MLSTQPNHQILGGKERRKEENEPEESNGTGRLASNDIIVSISPFEQFLLVLFGSKNCTCCIQGLRHGWAQDQKLITFMFYLLVSKVIHINPYIPRVKKRMIIWNQVLAFMEDTCFKNCKTFAG